MNGTLEYKFTGSGKTVIRGYGAFFNNIDSYGDAIAPGAFKDAIKRTQSGEFWPAMLLQHGGLISNSEDMTPVGVWTKLEEDRHGLVVEGTLADTTRGRDLVELLQMAPRPAINGLSIGYQVDQRDIVVGRGASEPRRTLKKINLYEVSIVTFPANPLATIRGPGLAPAKLASHPIDGGALTGLLQSLRQLDGTLRSSIVEQRRRNGS